MAMARAVHIIFAVARSQSVLAVGAVILFPAFGYLFYIFKARRTV